MGSDDIEAFNVARDLDVFSFDLLLLATEEQRATLLLRWAWVCLNEVILISSQLFGKVELLGYPLGYLICAVMPAIATWLALFVVGTNVEKNCKDTTSEQNSFPPAVIILAFATSFIHFFNGIHVESYVILLFALRISVQDSPRSPFRFIVDCAIVSIKPYYVVIILGLIIRQYSLKALLQNGLYIAAVLLPTVAVNILMGLNGHSYADVPFRINLLSIFTNVFHMNFGVSFGLLWCYFPAVVLCLFGAKLDRYLIQRVIAVLLLQIFLGSVNWWHGGSPGNRYLAPLFLIFIPEMVAGWRCLRQQMARARIIIVILFTLSCLPILEYRNTAVREYSANTVQSGKPIGYNNNDASFFDPSEMLLNPIIFANVILVSKLTKQPDDKITLAGHQMRVGDVYPTTIGARMLYLSSQGSIHNENVVSAQVQKLAVQLMPIIAGITVSLYCFILMLVFRVLFWGRLF